jgi:DNA polymerase-3 subunit epsilon
MKRLVLDTETTGLYPNRHQVLTVGLIEVDVSADHLEFLSEAHIFIKHPEYNISSMAMQINNIDIESHNLKATPVKEAMKQIDNFMDNGSLWKTPLLGHNLHFDQRFLKFLFQEHDYKYPFSEEKDDTRYIWQRFGREGLIDNYTNAKLGTVADHFGIDYSQAHDALADCRITAEVFHRLLKMKSI